MSFPFGTGLGLLRQRMLFAISSGSALGLGALGCGGTSDLMQPQGAGSSAQQTSAGQGSAAGSSAGMSPTSGPGVPAGKPPMTPTDPLPGSVPMVPMTAMPPLPAAGSAGPMVAAGGSMALAGTGPSAGGVSGGDPLLCPNGMSEPVCYTRSEMETKVRNGCGQILPDPVPTDEEVAAAFLDDGCLPADMACDGCCNPAELAGEPQGDGSCCYVYCPGACCGRPFTVDGAARLAAVTSRADWLRAGSDFARGPDVPAEIARRIALEWLDDARMEHASIASFARFTLELLAVGAPAELVEQAQRAALDEVRHAQLCFALASRYAGGPLGPMALATADAAPAQWISDAAARAFVEGCVGETTAAALARAALEHAREPEARAALASIAADEARHAELAWRFVAWAIGSADHDVARAVREALAAAEAELPDGPLPSDPFEVQAELRAAGRLPASERRAVARACFRDVIAPCAHALLARAGEPELSPETAARPRRSASSPEGWHPGNLGRRTRALAES